MQSTNSRIHFDELTKQVFDLKDVILGDIERGFDRSSSEVGDDSDFDHHKAVTRSWFTRVSSSNKKRFLLVLLRDVQSAWTLSLLLKSIWNCRPKDAVPSPFEEWSIYDQVPLDHNRSVMPLELLVEVMESERKWFQTLEPYRQTQLLSELLKYAGGPIIWSVFYKAQEIFENYRDFQLLNIQECMTVVETSETKTLTVVDDKGKKAPAPARRPSANGGETPQTNQPISPEAAQRVLDTRIAQWNSIIKTLKDSQKLEEVELSFSDGTTRRMWKVNRPKPEVTETVDYIQLLPLTIAKQILNYVPRTDLNECARVNKYWAYLVDELKAELAARLKIVMEIKKLTEIIQKHDLDIDYRDHSIHTFQTATTGTISYVSKLCREPTAAFSGQAEPQRSQKSAAYSVFKQILRTKKRAQRLPPIRNLAELSERLNRRGAADDNLWDWCKKALELYKKPDYGKVTFPPVANQRRSMNSDGVMTFRNVHFPCPLMAMSVDLPLKPALRKNFTTVAPAKKKVKSADTHTMKMVKLTNNKPRKRYSLWSKDFSSLYTAFKIPCYKSPV